MDATLAIVDADAVGGSMSLFNSTPPQSTITGVVVTAVVIDTVETSTATVAGVVAMVVDIDAVDTGAGSNGTSPKTQGFPVRLGAVILLRDDVCIDGRAAHYVAGDGRDLLGGTLARRIPHLAGAHLLASQIDPHAPR